MESSPLVSVVISCFNSTRYLAAAIESVLGQTYRNIELILVDDCSTDGTVALINEYKGKDDRIRLVQRHERGGRPAITKNTGLEHIKGKFVCFLDHDDYYHPRKIESLLTLLLDNSECVAAFHDVDLVDGEGGFISRYLEDFPVQASDYISCIDAKTYLCDNRFYIFQSVHYAALHTISVMIAVERFGRENLYFDTRYYICEDTDLWIRLGMAGRMVYLDDALACYRQHGTNITRDQIKLQEYALLLMENNFPRVIPAMRNNEKKLLKARISHYYADLGWMYRCKYIPYKSIHAYVNAWKWSGFRKYPVHAIKALFPVRSI